MKKLINPSVSVSGGKLTFTADIVDADAGEFRFPVQQSTVGYLNPENMAWPRHVQISNEAIFVKAFGFGMAFSNDILVEIASRVEPKTSYPPVFKKQPDEKGLTVEISSELNPDFQWQVSASLGKDADWKMIEGQTSNTLDTAKVLKGQFVRCVAHSDAGMMISNPATVQ